MSLSLGRTMKGQWRTWAQPYILIIECFIGVVLSRPSLTSSFSTHKSQHYKYFSFRIENRGETPSLFF